MRTIEISDEIYNKLMDISKEINSQDHLATAMPYLFQIRDYRRTSSADGNEDGYELIDDEGNTFDFSEKSFDEVIESLEEYEMEYPKELLEDKVIEELEDWLTERTEYPLFQKMCYQKIEKFSNGFFTKKSAQNFLDTNDYHFTEDAKVYLNDLWRNPEMELIMQFLCELSGGKIHK